MKARMEADLEKYIHACGELMQKAMARWEAHGCFSDRGEADRFRLLMEAAIKSRSPGYAAHLERDRGIGV